jgi:hypothetical protein
MPELAPHTSLIHLLSNIYETKRLQHALAHHCPGFRRRRERHARRRPILGKTSFPAPPVTALNSTKVPTQSHGHDNALGRRVRFEHGDSLRTPSGPLSSDSIDDGRRPLLFPRVRRKLRVLLR